jgi:hypothetical protein
MKYLILIFSLVFTTLIVSPEESFAQVTCEGSPAEDNRAGRKKVKKWDNCKGVQFYHTRKIELKYDGFFIKGKRNGQGTEEILAPAEFFGEIYIGEFKRNKRTGQGSLVYASGDKYVGEVKNSIRSGQGKYISVNGDVQEGYWEKDILINGKYILVNGDFQEGYWEKNFLVNGFVDSEMSDGAHYVGDWKNKLINGQGKYTWPNGDFQEGYWEKGFLINGFYDGETSEGAHYVGDWKNKGAGGQGKFTWPNGEFLEGYFENSFLINGFMDRTYNGTHYVGEFKMGKKNGFGTTTFPNGRVQEGIWKDDQFQYAQNNTPQPEARPQITVKKPPNDDKIILASSGSGFAVSSDGYVITNNHVIEQCQQVNIHYQGNEIPATVVTYDKQNDLALLKGDFKPETVFSLASNSPGLLQDIYVAGYPYGLGISSQIKVTRGIISSLTGTNNDFSRVQIDAAIQGGNSGGPIVDEMGNVVGVAVSKLSAEFVLENYGSIPENTNFGVKINLVKNILESNNIKILSENKTTISKPELAKRVSTGTYYISCGMTMALIESLKTQKVFFNHLN